LGISIGAAVSGRGIAYVQRGATRVAIVAEVEVDRSSGRIWARKFTVAHDRGQIIIPDGLRHTIEGNLVQGISRALWEEVGFDRKRVTSVDWLTYPILDITETPEAIDIVLIDRECQIFCVWGPVSLPRDIVAIDWGSITS
jgi:nicotinate dehydrogenase subunit B